MFCPRDVPHLLTVELGEPDVDRIVALAAHYGAEVLEDWP